MKYQFFMINENFITSIGLYCYFVIQILNLNDSKKTDLSRDKWKSINPIDVYVSTEEWFLKKNP